VGKTRLPFYQGRAQVSCFSSVHNNNNNNDDTHTNTHTHSHTHTHIHTHTRARARAHTHTRTHTHTHTHAGVYGDADGAGSAASMTLLSSSILHFTGDVLPVSRDLVMILGVREHPPPPPFNTYCSNVRISQVVLHLQVSSFICAV
jgi:hypothetical protein